MQTIAVFSAPTPGVLTINGRFAGEAGPDMPLMMPVTPNGVLYTIFMPFSRRCRPCAHRLRTVSGKFETDPAPDMCRMLIWPGGVCEFSFAPPAAYPPESEFGTLEGRPVAILRGEASMLRVGQSTVALPDGAQLPDARIIIGGAEIYLGGLTEGRYAAAYSANDLSPLGSISADSIELTENGLLRAVTAMRDTVGHSRMAVFRPADGGFEQLSAEYLWSHGAPKWPDSPEKAVIAAVEAAMLGLGGEASGYIAPAMQNSGVLSAVSAGYDAVIPMKYLPADPRPAVALVKRISPCAARITPLYYHAVPDGGPQGPWLIDRMQI